MKHGVRKNLGTLLVGVAGQRVLQLATFLCIGRTLGAERLGLYAQGVALAAVLSMLAGAGVRNLLARTVASAPTAAGALLRRAVRTRLAAGGPLAAAAAAIAFASSDAPWFWTLFALQVLPAAFDLKTLLDTAGRARAEVALETAAAALQLALVAVWLAFGGRDLGTLAAIALLSRVAYAAVAANAIAALVSTQPATAAPLRREAGAVIGQTAHEILAAADVWLVAFAFGDGASGLYAVAARFAGAALLPSAQLARLLLPHVLHAAADGDPGRTLATSVRATLLATLPVAAGGIAVAPRLCTLPGAEFAAAAPALAVLLLAGCLQHGGWQYSHALLALGRDRDYGSTFAGPAVLQVIACFVLGALSRGHGEGADASGALLGAAAALLAHGTYVWRARRAVAPHLLSAPVSFAAPLAIAAATWAAAAAPALCGAGHVVLALQLTSGGAVFLAGVWLVELRGRLHRLGDGLAAASGFRS